MQHRYLCERRLNLNAHGRRPCPRGTAPGFIGEALAGGCPDCWSTRFWRWVCRDCDYLGRWVDASVPADLARLRREWADHLVVSLSGSKEDA